MGYNLLSLCHMSVHSFFNATQCYTFTPSHLLPSTHYYLLSVHYPPPFLPIPNPILIYLSSLFSPFSFPAPPSNIPPYQTPHLTYDKYYILKPTRTLNHKRSNEKANIKMCRYEASGENGPRIRNVIELPAIQGEEVQGTSSMPLSTFLIAYQVPAMPPPKPHPGASDRSF